MIQYGISVGIRLNKLRVKLGVHHAVLVDNHPIANMFVCHRCGVHPPYVLLGCNFLLGEFIKYFLLSFYGLCTDNRGIEINLNMQLDETIASASIRFRNTSRHTPYVLHSDFDELRPAAT